MHNDFANMRTTIEVDAEHRAELLRPAARRGVKGFSQIVKEALNEYLLHQKKREQAIRSALSLQGCLSGKAAKQLRERTAGLRELWRCS